jgi:hypothetical protein
MSLIKNQTTAKIEAIAPAAAKAVTNLLLRAILFFAATPLTLTYNSHAAYQRRCGRLCSANKG